MAERTSSRRSSRQSAVVPTGELLASAPSTYRESTIPGAYNERPATSRESTAKKIKDMTVEELEASLASNPARKPPHRVRSSQAPQTARALLEENKQLIQEKQERKALARKNSREFVEQILAQDRRTTEGDKAKEIDRRLAQRELAQYYKSRIAEKERDKANAYKCKLESGVDVNYFPFVEGEIIDRTRNEKCAKQREEMRGFLEKQRESKPPRMDSLLAETAVDNRLTYLGATSSTGSKPDHHSLVHSLDADDDVAPHMARYPRFLSRSREHMSRRLHDEHVKKSLEKQVEQTKAELAIQRQRAEVEHQQWEDGILINDALRYDNGQARAMERRRQGEHLKKQIAEKQKRIQDEKDQKRAEVAGYWGPEEKEVQDGRMYQSLTTSLINQMEVDKQRRSSSRQQKLRQERRLIDNCFAEMALDRDKERHKEMQHREVLTTTWKSQEKIKEAVKSFEHF